MIDRARNSIHFALAFIIVSFAVSACVAPERGEATITVNKDGSYSFAYKGGMAFLLGLAAKAEGKRLSTKDEKDINSFAQELTKDKEFRSAKSSGFARADVDYLANRKTGQSFKFIGDANIISITADPKSHRLIIKSAAFDTKNMRELSAIAYKPDIKLTITSELPIISHNGALDKSWFLRDDRYEWRITLSPRPPVSMVMKLP